jgi:hypothetical protein
MADHTDDQPKSDHTNRAGGFFQINIGHVLTIVMIIGSLVRSGADLTSKLTKLEVIGDREGASIAELRAEIGEFKSEIGDVRQWRDRQEGEDSQWRVQTTQNFGDIKAHLERLDEAVDQSSAQGRTMAARRPRQ